MARLKEYNGYYCESEYEYAFIGFLETEGWIYSSGNNISRVTKRDVLIWWRFLPSFYCFSGVFRHHFSILMALSATITFFSLI